MSSAHHHKTLGRTCEGEHLAIWGLCDQDQLDLALTQILVGRESRGIRVPVVTLLMRRREDAEWITQAVDWLATRGRRVIVRTRVVMPKTLVAALVRALPESGGARGGTGAGAVVELELAHQKPAIQRALLGREADPVAALLLQAQHLETCSIPVVARLAPLLPGIHDQANGFEPLLRNVQGADIRRAVVEVGRLHPEQIRNLVEVARDLSVAGLLELARAFGVDPMIFLGGAELPHAEPGASEPRSFKLKPRRARVLEHGLEALARDAGLEIPSCPGSEHCRAYCALTGATRDSSPAAANYESVMGRDLFAGLEAG
ncbi:hypothetical protein G6O69_00580 [Pseudenhygromyxa sp. WMMC2535]|uniref:hypothetical protein n=1 Tax=Pseudenhygromyxa sp. WMMC2535 TaxID=2712867 RepID=UPI001554A18D|nr:hypothetical protein [Pseudenhygromyxa sp. WMMC2535]NVB36306.1 hypothetical protein [Pseudenhygromyxa sp. WMMC2535]